jgi:Kdo2-lipid IVA lauroyltransferase/acyltransferase
MAKGYPSHIGIFFLRLLARIPLAGMYIISGVLFLLIYYVIGYRKKVVLDNLKHAFPEKTEEERKQTARRFYRHFSDLVLETIRMNRINKEELKKRMKVRNPEVINRFFEQGKSVVVLTMHYNNWEWTGVFPLFIKHKILGVYKPLHNKSYDEFLNGNRSRFGACMVPNALILRKVIQARAENEPVFIWLAGDQTPPFFHRFWMMFLNQETMFYPGPAAISRRFNYPVIFQKTEKIKRGFYEITFEVLSGHPADLSEEEIMKAYILKMEKTIGKHPEYYLWSHKRWKNKRPVDVPMRD